MFGFIKAKSEITDEVAMSKFQDGDIKGFELIVARYNKRVFRFISRMVYGNKTVAEDLFQEVFIKVIEKKTNYDRKRSFKTWLYTLTRNHVIDYVRREKYRKHDSLDRNLGDEYSNVTKLDFIKSKEKSQEKKILDKEIREQIYKKLDELNEEYKEVFILREIEGLKFNEIAEVTDTNVNTVKSRHRYAFKELREKLLETGFFDELKRAGEG